MVRVRRYVDQDVLTAARERIRHIYDLFDSVAVCFSGGKDSLVALHLTWEIAQELGLDHVDVIFRDEELIPDQVIDFVNEYRALPWVRMLYFAVPLASQKYILGRSYDYVQWEAGRRHIRPVPEHAITLAPGDDRVLDQYSMDAYQASFFKGKVAFVTGIRAAESLMRFRASVNKLNENYINASSAPNAWLCKPLYDWEENDVFKYFWENGIRYCPIYDAQLWAGSQLRVATPLHAEQAKRLNALRTISPTFYEQVLDLFPEMAVQDRYFAELDRDAIVKRYGESLAGVRAWIEENITDEHQLERALSRLGDATTLNASSPEAYPPEHLLKYFMAGTFKRMPMPIGRAQQERRRR